MRLNLAHIQSSPQPTFFLIPTAHTTRIKHSFKILVDPSEVGGKVGTSRIIIPPLKLMETLNLFGPSWVVEESPYLDPGS